MARYNILQPTSPVPVSRLAAVVGEAAKRWWDLYTRARGDDQYKWFDCDLALAEAGLLLVDLAEIEKLKGEGYVKEMLRRELATVEQRASA
ncbi:hypothetical protein [Methylobacterium sp. E-045]|uniref:hypothetical protein n=1 Tax=Methylobacterium sp. E-045 TaxID=2836575 RepID=UPI001FB8D8E7|nr:hypothetical protein [Methylobacterium sp. E-045]MCJ2129246.1 hypothetical protein [Methylobacterium sp. E-045]